MRLSYSIQRRIFETGVGFLLNKFQGKSRRNVLYFEDLSAQYVAICDKEGYGKDIGDISRRWGALTMKRFAPPSIDKLPSQVLHGLLRKVWINIGIAQDFDLEREGNIERLETKDESITRIIGKNSFMPGFYAGIFEGIFGMKVDCRSSNQTKQFSKYEFEVLEVPIEIRGKSKDEYNKLNHSKGYTGFSIENALKTNRFQLKGDNRIYFRSRSLSVAENTIFHLLGNRAILIDRLSELSFKHFKELTDKDSTDQEKLLLLKSLLQISGWGITKIVCTNSRTVIEILNPPYGLQLEENNWDVIAYVILGYLWLLDKDLRLLAVDEFYRKVRFTYA